MQCGQVGVTGTTMTAAKRQAELGDKNRKGAKRLKRPETTNNDFRTTRPQSGQWPLMDGDVTHNGKLEPSLENLSEYVKTKCQHGRCDVLWAHLREHCPRETAAPALPG